MGFSEKWLGAASPVLMIAALAGCNNSGYDTIPEDVVEPSKAFCDYSADAGYRVIDDTGYTDKDGRRLHITSVETRIGGQSFDREFREESQVSYLNAEGDVINSSSRTITVYFREGADGDPIPSYCRIAEENPENMPRGEVYYTFQDADALINGRVLDLQQSEEFLKDPEYFVRFER